MQGECSTMTRGPVRPLENAAAMRATDHAAKAIAQKLAFFAPRPPNGLGSPAGDFSTRAVGSGSRGAIIG